MASALMRSVRWLLDEKYNGKLTTAAIRRLAEDTKRLERGEHVAYVIGWSPFLGVNVDLSQKPLIPRPETELWTQNVIRDLRTMISDWRTIYFQSPATDHKLRVLDVFSGSGCIGLAVLAHIPQAHVTFADIEPRYFKGIRKSARTHDIPPRRFKTISSNVLKNIGVRERYDYILANPPYVPQGRKLDPSLEQEPQRALFGGKDGLRYIRLLLTQAPHHLAPDGRMVIEFDAPQKRAIGTLAKQLGYHATFFKDQYKKWRYAELSFRSRTVYPELVEG